MKKLIELSVFVLSLNLVANNQTEHQEIEGVLYKNYPETPYEGLLTIYYENGSVEEKLYYRNGLKDGSRNTFHENGKTIFKQGEQSWRRRGTVRQRAW